MKRVLIVSVIMVGIILLSGAAGFALNEKMSHDETWSIMLTDGDVYIEGQENLPQEKVVVRKDAKTTLLFLADEDQSEEVVDEIKEDLEDAIEEDFIPPEGD